MKSRIELQTKLEEILGSNHVYFQPPTSVSLKYPCFVYSFEGIDTIRANNGNYIKSYRYEITHIYKKLDNRKTEEILDSFQMISQNNCVVVDGVYNENFTLFI